MRSRAPAQMLNEVSDHLPLVPMVMCGPRRETPNADRALLVDLDVESGGGDDPLACLTLAVLAVACLLSGSDRVDLAVGLMEMLIPCGFDVDKRKLGHIHFPFSGFGPQILPLLERSLLDWEA
jgi:hypothetical protein